MDDLLWAWLKGLADFLCIYVELLPGTKRTRREWVNYERAHLLNGGSRLDHAYRWLASGSGLGILPRGSLWILDVDEGSWVEQVLSELATAGIFAPWVRTPSGGGHFYFRLPDGFKRERLKNHLCHPKDNDGRVLPLDFKFGPRTLVVAPGTRRNGGQYLPQTPWFVPPALDPAFFLKDGAFWKPPAQEFDIDDRPWERRVARACNYLKSSRTPVSISGDGGRKALATVAAYLVTFLQFDPGMAFHLLTHGPDPWNSRCRDLQGNAYPWSHDELWRACCDAVDAVPEAGVRLHRRRAQRACRDGRLRDFVAMLRLALIEGKHSCVWVSDLQASFEEWTGVALTSTAFGLGLKQAGFIRKRFTHARLWGVPGVDLDLLRSLLQGSAAPP